MEDVGAIYVHVYSFYKEHFMEEPRCEVALAMDCWPRVAMVSADENADITLPFLPKEVCQMLMKMKVSSAPGPNNLLVTFF